MHKKLIMIQFKYRIFNNEMSVEKTFLFLFISNVLIIETKHMKKNAIFSNSGEKIYYSEDTKRM